MLASICTLEPIELDYHIAGILHGAKFLQMQQQLYYRNYSRVEFPWNMTRSFRQHMWSRTITVICRFIFRVRKSTMKTTNNNPLRKIPAIRYHINNNYTCTQD